MLTIYSTPESLYCAKLRILLRHKQAKWQEITPVGGCGSDEYRQMIPSGTMPAMIDGELIIADSEAIAEYINERYPQPQMLPESIAARAKCRERSRFHDTRLEPEIRSLFPHIGPGKKGSEIARMQSQKISLRLAELDRLLAADASLNLNYLGLGDCGFPVSFAWLDAFQPVLDLDILWPERVREYRVNIEKHEAVAGVLQDYAAHISDWVESKNVQG
jgi:glutathione S-transferase/maleylpyruvate isomerase